MEKITFPESFMFGAATAATQVEGGEKGHTWYRWSEEGKITDGSSSIRACDHWNRVEEDVKLIQDMGLHTYRLGIEWSRIEPEPGVFDSRALAHYRGEIEALVKAGVRPLVTLWHFSNPLWFEDSGGWMRRDAPEVVLGYVRFVVEGLGDLVSDWVTINEPSVYLVQSYLRGLWPPGEKSIAKFLRGERHLIRAHHLMYFLIHEIRTRKGWSETSPTMVGVAHHLRVFEPLHSWNFLARGLGKIVEYLVQGSFLFPFTMALKSKFCADFIGVNYYTRDIIVLGLTPGELFTRQIVMPGAKTNDLGWEIYPEGLHSLLRWVSRAFKLPIWVTENGIADGKDAQRSEFIEQHLRSIRKCIDEGIDVQRYYHWSLMDNFEWIEGESARFGLIEVDYENQKRTVRPSGKRYAKLCKTREWDCDGGN